jgi:hypothetical protein
MKTCSELISEMVGPAGSTSKGAFSCTNPSEEDEPRLSPDCLSESLLVDWARDEKGGRTTNRQSKAAERMAEDRNALNVMKHPVQF